MIDGMEKVLWPHIAGNAANFLMVLDHDEGWDDIDAGVEAERFRDGVIDVEKADRHVLGAFGRLVGRQHVAPEQLAVGAPRGLHDDQFEIAGRQRRFDVEAGVADRNRNSNECGDGDKESVVTHELRSLKGPTTVPVGNLAEAGAPWGKF